AVMICARKSSSERFLFCSATVSEASEDSRSALAWSNWFCTSRVSSCTMSAPGFTRVPVSTGISVIWPEARDFTSTTLIGSMMPVASAWTTIVRRSIGAVEMRSGAAAFLPQAATRPRAARKARERRRGDTGNLNKGRMADDGCCGDGDRRPRVCLLQVAADEGLDLRLGRAGIQASLDEVAAGLVERGLRIQDVEQRRGAERVALLLHAEVFLAGGDAGELDLDAHLGGAEGADLLDELLARIEAGVAQLGLGVLDGHAGREVLLLAVEAVED